MTVQSIKPGKSRKSRKPCWGHGGRGSMILVQVSPKSDAHLLGSPKTRENPAEGEF